MSRESKARAVIEKLARKATDGILSSENRYTWQDIAQGFAPLEGLIEAADGAAEISSSDEYTAVPTDRIKSLRAALRAVYEAAGGEK